MGPQAAGNERRGHVFPDVEGQGQGQARITHIGERVEFLLGTLRIVTQLRNAIARLGPGLQQFDPTRPENQLGITAQADLVLGIGFANEVIGQRSGTQLLGDARTVLTTNLDHRSQLLGKQAGKQMVIETTLERVGLLLQPVYVIHVGVVADRVEHQRQTAACCESHLAHRGEQATVGTIVVGQQHVVATQLLDGLEESLQLQRVDVGCVLADRVVGLREHRAAEAIPALAQIDQQQFGVDALRQL